jgi:hypothetical protein
MRDDLTQWISQGHLSQIDYPCPLWIFGKLKDHYGFFFSFQPEQAHWAHLFGYK